MQPMRFAQFFSKLHSSIRRIKTLEADCIGTLQGGIRRRRKANGDGHIFLCFPLPSVSCSSSTYPFSTSFSIQWLSLGTCGEEIRGRKHHLFKDTGWISCRHEELSAVHTANAPFPRHSNPAPVILWFSSPLYFTTNHTGVQARSKGAFNREYLPYAPSN